MILVVVANIQIRVLKTEVEKGSMGTAVGHGLVDPHGNSRAFTHSGYAACRRTPLPVEAHLTGPINRRKG